MEVEKCVIQTQPASYDNTASAASHQDVHYKTCTCDALALAVVKGLEIENVLIKEDSIHTAMLQKYDKNEGRYPESFNGEYKVRDKGNRILFVNIDSYKVVSFDDQYPHVLLVVNHSTLGNHAMYVTEKLVPSDGQHKGEEVYVCTNKGDVENPEPYIPVKSHGNMLYRIDVKWRPFAEHESNSSINDNVVGSHIGEINDDGAEEISRGNLLKRAVENDDDKSDVLSNCDIDVPVTPSKRRYAQNITIDGYVDGVTKVMLAKSGKVRYFKFAVVSNNSSSYDVVCFDSGRHQEISKINRKIIYEFRNLYCRNEEIQMKADTEWFERPYLKYEKHLPLTHISDAISGVKLYSRIHIRGIIYNSLYSVTLREKIERRIGTVQDKSGFMKLTIFNAAGKTISEDTCYEMTYLRVTEYKGRRILCSTDESKFKKFSVNRKFPLMSFLREKNKNADAVGIQCCVGKIVSFKKHIEKNLCPDCKLEVTAYENDRVYCENPDCETDLQMKECAVVLRYLPFKLKLEKKKKWAQNNADPLLVCDSMLLDILLDQPCGYDTTMVYKDKLIGRQVEVTFDIDDFEVLKIKFP